VRNAPQPLQDYLARCKLERQKRQVDIPPWVPAPVRRYVRWIEKLSLPPMGADEERLRELAATQLLGTAPEMQRVWRELKRIGASDQQLWLFMACACSDAWHPPAVCTEKERAELVTMWNTAAMTCALEHGRVIAKAKGLRPFLGRPEMRAAQRANHQLAAALEKVARHFVSAAEEWRRWESPLFVKKHNKDDDEARAYALSLGDLTQREFGATLYRTIATTAGVALQRPVDWRRVRMWCAESSKSSSAILKDRK
jgi:hypothetical protein